MSEKKFYHSKKFWASAVGALVPVLNQYLGWGLTAEQVMSILAPVLAYTLGQGLADLGKNKAQ